MRSGRGILSTGQTLRHSGKVSEHDSYDAGGSCLPKKSGVSLVEWEPVSDNFIKSKLDILIITKTQSSSAMPLLMRLSKKKNIHVVKQQQTKSQEDQEVMRQ